MSDQRRHRSYRPGEWYAVLGDHATVLLPPSEKARVAGLWQLLDDGAGFEDTLDALIVSGLRGLPGFVLASEADGATRVVLRGAARAVLDGAEGEVVLEGSSATTWVERTVRGVTRMTLEVGPDDDGEHLRTDGGLVRVARLDEPPYRPGGHDLLDEPVDEPVDEPEEPAAEPAQEPAADWSPASVPPAPFAPASSPYPFATPPVAPSDVADGDDGDDGADPDATQAIVADPSAGAFAGGDEPTERYPEQAREPERPVARLDFSSGERVDVDRVVLVGRAPEARRFAASEQPRLVTVSSPHQEISSTHLEVRPGTGPDRGTAVATDLGSTNGTLLVRPGEDAVELRAGLAERLSPGAVLDLGDGVTIRVSDG